VAADGSSFVSQFRLSGIEAQPEGIYDTPRSIEGATLDMRLTLMPELRIELGQATLFDGDLRLHAAGHVTAEADGLAISLDASVPEADLVSVLYLLAGRCPRRYSPLGGRALGCGHA
jgi:hypothetical protein